MLGKRTQPMIGKISELLVSGNRVAFLDVVTSPKSPLDLKIQSPRGVKNYDLGGGVGLGIVAALDKSGGGDVGGSEILARYAMSSPSPRPRPIRAVPIPVINVKNCYNRACYEEPEMHDSFESYSYSYMTCHGPKNESFTTRTRGEHDGRKSKNVSIFCVSPARCPEDTIAFPVSDFLSSCHLCRKKLHGKDIYMYRGEKAFCSTECRERQIMMDDRKEQCRSEAKRSSVDVSSSPYAQGNIFSTGILAI